MYNLGRRLGSKGLEGEVDDTKKAFLTNPSKLPEQREELGRAGKSEKLNISAAVMEIRSFSIEQLSAI